MHFLRPKIALQPNVIHRMASLCLGIIFLLMIGDAFGQTIRLYNTTRGAGTLQELDLVTGAVLASNVGGVANGRGMAFSPLGGLYVANGTSIGYLGTNLSVVSQVINYVGETPHDVAFDVAGNMYVVTDLNVRVYNPSLTQTLVFAHGLATTTGDGNTNKGWGIAIRPDNGEIYVIGAQGLKRFHPTTGVQQGATIAGSAFGLAGIAFTGSAFSGVYFYVGNVISGVDQIRVYDVNLNLLRTFFAAHIGNPIDLEVNAANGDIYLFNTVVSNPANRFASNETVFGGFSGAANPTRGSALGSFEPTPLAVNSVQLKAIRNGSQNQVEWIMEGTATVNHFLIERSLIGGDYVELGQVTASSGNAKHHFEDNQAPPEKTCYRVRGIGQNGEQICAGTYSMEPASGNITVAQNIAANTLRISVGDAKVHRLKVRLLSMEGSILMDREEIGSTILLENKALASGIYVLEIEGRNEQGMIVASSRQRVGLIR